MARKTGNPSAIRNRAAKTAAAMGSSSAVTAEAAPKKPFNLAVFYREVQSEVRKITWPSRRETWITSVMVGIMVLTAAVFFWLVDAGVSFSVNAILKLASGG